MADFNRTVETGTQALLNYFQHHRHISRYLELSVIGAKGEIDKSNLTQLMKTSLNQFLIQVRKEYWSKLLEFRVVAKKMTSKRIKEFQTMLQKNESVDFTEFNIRTFITNLMKDYDSFLIGATVDVFDMLTHEYAYDEDIHNGNVHYFNGWKTNKAFFCNKKVIIPFWGSAFWDADWKRWQVRYDIKDKLNDIDKVMNSFDGAIEYTSIVSALNKALDEGQNHKIKSTYFEITVYKKGTMHLTFLDPDVLRRFNITACRDKNWLPMDYGQKRYNRMTSEEQKVADAFEGKKSYEANFTSEPRLFRGKTALQIEHLQESEKEAA